MPTLSLLTSTGIQSSPCCKRHGQKAPVRTTDDPISGFLVPVAQSNGADHSAMRVQG
ncbi:hypothetical protein SAMN04488005_0172 [Yoonia tamlensis]|uniref:Uncharacterized protein n=1 Tax=Yoonia tamlensis TaxID=390270 RepID=A0A1I6FPB7_9RHOB|nr:hypothetical protein SAMN04488005_0172 [Yoonia tamlensis]